jgi:rRNA-processing protein FCF1
MYKDESKSSSLAKFLSIYDYVFVDTCSLMEDGFPAFMDTLEASKEYWKDGLKIIVPSSCVSELKKHSHNKDSNEARIEAKRALKILRHVTSPWHRIIEISKDDKDKDFADNVIFSTVSALRIKYKILIITQDRTLATDLRKLNDLDSQHGRYLSVNRLTPEGTLEETPDEVVRDAPNHSVRDSARSLEGTKNIRRSEPKPERTSRPFSEHHDDKPRFNKPRSHEEEEWHEPTNPLMVADRHLCANLSNPNYLPERRLSDIDAQLDALKALPSADLAKLQLAYTIPELEAEKQKLLPSVPNYQKAVPAKVVSKPEAKAAPAPVKPVAPVTPVVVATPAAKAVEPSAPVRSSLPSGVYYENGDTLYEALTLCCSKKGIILRDASVPYFPAVHGPVDLSSRDVEKLAKELGALALGASLTKTFGPYQCYVEKTSHGYKAALYEAKAALPSAVKAPEKTPDIVPQKAAVPAVKEEPKALPEKAQKEEVKKVAPKASKASSAARKASSSVSSPDNNTAVPAGATLVVGVPEERTKEYIERKSRREDQATLHTARRDGSVEKPAAPKKAEHAAPKKVAIRKSPVARKAVAAAPKKAAPAPQAKKAPAPKKSSAALLTAQKEDKDLNAKINNPKYSDENKIADLTAQQARLAALSPSDQKNFFFTKDKIAAKLAELKAHK